MGASTTTPVIERMSWDKTPPRAGDRLTDFAQLLGAKIGVAFALVPRFVQRQLRYFVDLVPALEQATRCFMAQIVKAQAMNPQELARVRAAPTLLGSQGKMYGPVCGG